MTAVTTGVLIIGIGLLLAIIVSLLLPTIESAFTLRI